LTYSDDAAEGWRPYRAEVPAEDLEPILLCYCPCAERKVGPLAGERDANASSVE
jgi:hypothetical protein